MSMTIDKNYFLSRLQNGENMDDIGAEIASLMTEAIAEHKAELEAKADREAAKRDLIKEMIEIVQELAILEGMDPDELGDITDEEMDQVVAAFTEMFNAMREIKKSMETATKSDDQILSEFAKFFS